MVHGEYYVPDVQSRLQQTDNIDAQVAGERGRKSKSVGSEHIRPILKDQRIVQHALWFYIENVQCGVC